MYKSASIWVKCGYCGETYLGSRRSGRKKHIRIAGIDEPNAAYVKFLITSVYCPITVSLIPVLLLETEGTDGLPQN